MEPHFGSNSAFPINLSTTSLSMNFFIPDNFQKVSCKQYKERCHEKIYSLTKSLQQYKSFYKQSQFIRKFIKYIPVPSVLEVPEIKYFSRILKHFRKHIITVYQLLSDAFDDSFNDLPSAQYLIIILLLNIIPSSNISNEIITSTISIIEKSDLSVFDEYVDVTILAMIEHHKEIIRSSLSNGIILINNQPDSSDENQLHFEDQPSNDTQSPLKSYIPLSSTSSQYSSIASIIVSNSIVGPEKYSPPETAEEVIPIIPSLCCSTTVGSIVEECNIVEYHLTTSTIVYPKILNLTLLFKKEKVFFPTSIYHIITFFGRKLRMLEQLSHHPMIVASDVVSVG
jgi:hypothetical protein